jgi:hypothetical protein
MVITAVAHLWWRPLERLTGWRRSVEDAFGSLVVLLSLPRLDATENDSSQDKSGTEDGAEDDACYGTTRESRSRLAVASSSGAGCRGYTGRCAGGEERLHRSSCWQSNTDAAAFDVRGNAARVCRVDSTVLAKGAKPSQIALVTTLVGLVLHGSNAVPAERLSWV